MQYKLLVTLIAGALLMACSSEQLYATGRNAQRAECLKRADMAERDRCLKDAELPYETYRRETGGTAK